jgi:hypothetical protein
MGDCGFAALRQDDRHSVTPLDPKGIKGVGQTTSVAMQFPIGPWGGASSCPGFNDRAAIAMASICPAFGADDRQIEVPGHMPSKRFMQATIVINRHVIPRYRVHHQNSPIYQFERRCTIDWPAARRRRRPGQRWPKAPPFCRRIGTT